MRDKLIQIQNRNGWADSEMAERLGVARTTWTEVKNGRNPISARMQMAAASAFPELLGDLVTSVTLTQPETAA